MENEGSSNKVVEVVGDGVSKVEVKESDETLRAVESVADIRAEVDMLADGVSALEVAVAGGTKIKEGEFIASSELLMRQLLKLDAIKVERKAKKQRKAECGVSRTSARLWTA